MKIFHINCNYLSTTLHQCLIEHLEPLGVENRIFAPIYPGFAQKIRPNDNVQVSECFQKRDRFLFFVKQEKILRAAKSVFSEARFDCIHAHTLFTDGVCARRLSRESGTPYVVAVRNTDVNLFLQKRVLLRPLGLKVLRDAAKVVFLSDPYRRKVLDTYVPEKYRGEIEAKSVVIPNGIDDFWLSNSYAEKNPPAALEPPLQLLFAGRVLPDKNLRGVVSAVQLLRAKGYAADFTVIGPHPDRSLYEELKQYDFVTLKEPMEKEKLIDAYRSADIFVMPSFHETFGLVYAEAMSQGLPVIYSKGEGFDGQFPDGEVGFAVDPGDPRKIADAIKLTAGMYGTISAACPEKVKKFNWNQIADNYHSFYEEICYEISTDNRAST